MDDRGWQIARLGAIDGAPALREERERRCNGIPGSTEDTDCIVLWMSESAPLQASGFTKVRGKYTSLVSTARLTHLTVLEERQGSQAARVSEFE